MALDRCLPDFLLQTNKWRGTNHYIIVGFFLVCTSLYLILQGNTVVLAGIYAMRFVCVSARVCAWFPPACVVMHMARIGFSTTDIE